MAGFYDMPDEDRRTSRKALVASVLLHLLVVAILMVGIPRFSRDQSMMMSVPVEMLTEDDLLSEQVARTEAEPVEEAESESLSEAEAEEATAETQAESATAAQPETASAAEAPRPAESRPAEAVAEAQPMPPVPPAAPESQPEEPAPEASEVVAVAEQAPAATVEETDSEITEAPEAELAEASPPADEAEAEELAAAEPQQVEATEAEPAPDAPPSPRRRPEDVPTQVQQAQAEPQSEPGPEPVQEDDPPPPEPEPEEEADPLASILRSVEDLEPQQRQQATAPTPADNDAAPRTSIAVQRRAAELGDLIRDQVATCWRIDGGLEEARSMRVPIRVRLAPDGSVIGDPGIQEPTRYRSDSYYRSAADAAVRAVLRCAPLQLPPQDYDIWRDLVLNFDPREMFGG